jgi:membrane associated rhomboid family serine protease
MHFLILALVLLGVGVYFATHDERARLLRAVLRALRDVKNAVTLEDLGCDSFFDALRARTPWVVVTPSLIVLSATVFVFMAFDPGARTTHGEWWRLVTAILVHSRVLDLLVSAVCLLQLGLILERLLGPLVFTTVYGAAGVAAGIVSLTLSRDSVSVGASGSVLGLYGLLVVTSIWSMTHRSSLTIPLNVTKRLAPVAAIFVLYNVVTTGLGNAAELTALVCGVVGGIVVARDVNQRTPPIRRISAVMATIVAIVTVSLVTVTVLHRPPTEITDVGPAIERVIAVEGYTAGIYDHAVDGLRKGRITAPALAELIEQTIVPELHAVATRLHALQDVPPEHRPLVATAEEFLKLRDESWQLRAAALHKADMLGLRRADTKEQASLEAFHRVKTPRRVGGG